MSKFNKKKEGGIPAINTAALPDIVFMLLFFFMVATTMREDELKIENVLPVADQVEKLGKSSPVAFIYIGKPSANYVGTAGTQATIQLNDKFADASQIASFIAEKRASLRENQVSQLTVSLKADKNVNMGIIGDVKQALREVSALKLNYGTGNGNALDNMK